MFWKMPRVLRTKKSVYSKIFFFGIMGGLLFFIYFFFDFLKSIEN